MQQRRRQSTARHSFASLAGEAPAFAQAIRTARRYAPTDLTVLIAGETGTGKELFAQAMHDASARAAQPFIAVNCASFPESLLESELFGYEEGAFTGARRGGKRGLVEAAHTGTLFLDEIGDMPLALQEPAAACAAGARSDAAGRQQRHPGGPARDRRHPPAAGRAGAHAALPAGPVLPHQHAVPGAAAAAAPGAKTSCRWPRAFVGAQPGAPGLAAGCGAGAGADCCPCCRPTAGPAMCASCATSANASRCSSPRTPGPKTSCTRNCSANARSCSRQARPCRARRRRRPRRWANASAKPCGWPEGIGQQAARLLGVSRSTLWRWLREGS